MLAIGRAIRDRGLPPTLRELIAVTDIGSTSIMTRTVGRLGDAGLIARVDRGVSRGLLLTPAGRAWLAARGIIVPGADPAGVATVFAAAARVVDVPNARNVAALRVALAEVAS